MARSRVELFEQIRRDWRAGGSSIRELAVCLPVPIRRASRWGAAEAVGVCRCLPGEPGQAAGWLSAPRVSWLRLVVPVRLVSKVPAPSGAG